MTELESGDNIVYEGDEDWEVRGVFKQQLTIYHPERDKWTTALKENVEKV